MTARCVVEDGWPLRRAAERFQASATTAPAGLAAIDWPLPSGFPIPSDLLSALAPVGRRRKEMRSLIRRRLPVEVIGGEGRACNRLRWLTRLPSHPTAPSCRQVP